MFLYFHERTCTRAVIHTMSTAEIGDSDLSDRWPEWAKLGKGEGSSPLWATDLYEKRMFVAFVCVWLYRGCMTLRDFYGLWSDLGLENRRWHTQTHSWFPPMWYVYQQARSGIPFHQNKSQLSDCATFDNVTLLLPTCTFQPTLIRHSPPFTSPQNPFHPFFTSSSAVFHLDVSGLDSDIDHCCRLRASSPSCDKSFPDSQML